MLILSSKTIESLNNLTYFNDYEFEIIAMSAIIKNYKNGFNDVAKSMSEIFDNVKFSDSIYNNSENFISFCGNGMSINFKASEEKGIKISFCGNDKDFSLMVPISELKKIIAHYI